MPFTDEQAEQVGKLLREDPELASQVYFDLFAILKNEPTQGQYSFYQWWYIRRALTGLSVTDLESMIGEPSWLARE